MDDSVDSSQSTIPALPTQGQTAGPMFDLLIISLFFSMLLFPCLVASRSTRPERAEVPATRGLAGVRKTAK